MARRLRIKDRREFPRFPADLALEVTRQRSPAPGLNAGMFEARCVDLSRAGIKFRTRELFHRHEKLLLTFLSPDGQSDLNCEIEVVRSIRLSRQYEVAARIIRCLPDQ